MDLLNLETTNVRGHMAAEITADVTKGSLYVGVRLTPAGKSAYPKLLAAAAAKGSPASLAEILKPLMAVMEMSTSSKGKVFEKKVPVNAADMLAEGEFNRFYARAVCIEALAAGQQLVEVYRAKQVSAPRAESEAKIGTKVDAANLLADLRASPGVDTALGVPAGPNSGLSVKLVS